MSGYDFIIIGGGSAGCVLANRLSADPDCNVLLIEAGSAGRGPLVTMPKGFGALIAKPAFAWHYAVEGEADRLSGPEMWPRGRMLGGTSGLNGLMYLRGQPEDYDGWEALGLAGWGWADMAPCFRAIEDHELGADDLRGQGGPLHVSIARQTTPFYEAVIATGEALGLERKRDLNRLDQEGIGFLPRTIRRGRRQSAAAAFLDPIRSRRNLDIRIGLVATRLIVEGHRASGVVCRSTAGEVEFRTHGEVIVSCGAIESPKLLQLSGIGSGERSRSLDIPVIADSPGVGSNLREHHLFPMQLSLRQEISENREYGGWRLYRNLLRYAVSRGGVLATAPYGVGAFIRTRPGLSRPDAELQWAPFSFAGAPMAFEQAPGMQVIGYPLRSESQGQVTIESPDASHPPVIRPNYFSAEADRRVALDLLRFMRRFAATEPLRSLIDAETVPGTGVQTDEEVLEYLRRTISAGFHAVGSCSMGPDGDVHAVLDARLKVRGVTGLRVVDCSIMPRMVSANTNGPVMAVAWRAADLIMADRKGGRWSG